MAQRLLRRLINLLQRRLINSVKITFNMNCFKPLLFLMLLVLTLRQARQKHPLMIPMPPFLSTQSWSGRTIETKARLAAVRVFVVLKRSTKCLESRILNQVLFSAILLAIPVNCPALLSEIIP